MLNAAIRWDSLNRHSTLSLRINMSKQLKDVHVLNAHADSFVPTLQIRYESRGWELEDLYLSCIQLFVFLWTCAKLMGMCSS